MKEFDFRVINADYGLYSCALEEISDSYKEQHEKQGRKLEQIIIYYYEIYRFLLFVERVIKYRSERKVGASV